MSLFRLVALLCAFAALSGCAFGQKIDYRQSSPYLSARSGEPVELAVIDARPYVLNSSKNATFVGRIRGLYYNPFNVNTYTGDPLSSDIREALRSALSKVSISVPGTYSSTKASPGNKLLVVRLNEWKMDAYMKVRFDYDITATVLDEHGAELATKTAKSSGPTTNVIVAGTDALGSLLNSREILDALSSNAEPLPSLVVPATQSASQAYDECMRRVGRVSDPSLRIALMSTCDTQ